MRLRIAFIFSLACVVLVASDNPEKHVDAVVTPNINESWPWHPKTTSTSTTTTTEPPTPPPSPTPPTTTSSTQSPTPPPPPTTTSTTQSPTPSPPPTTTSTTQPPSPPTTSTTQPPTPSPPTTSTTQSPTTPSPASTTTTPHPPPTPAPLDHGNWTVSGENVTCIYLQATLSAKVQYPLISKGVGQKTITIPNNATASGTCGNTSDILTLSWNKNNAVFTFSKLVNSSQYDLANVTLSLAADNNTFPNVSQEIKTLEYRSSAPLFITSLSASYQCSAEKNCPLLNGTAPNGTEILGSLQFHKLHLQAFSEERVARFGSPEDCDEDASDMVPIVVGCSLAALVVIILGVYVWGRRRSSSRGYLSM